MDNALLLRALEGIIPVELVAKSMDAMISREDADPRATREELHLVTPRFDRTTCRIAVAPAADASPYFASTNARARDGDL